MQQLNEALFFSIAKQDYENAGKLLDNGANPNSMFEIQKGKHISTFNLFIRQTATIGHKKGPGNNQYKVNMELIKKFIKISTLQCKCLKEHKCPLYIALEAFNITEEAQILEGKCDLIRFLIMNGATVRFQEKQTKKSEKILKGWRLKWFDIEGIKSYLITKNFNYVQTKV